ncbi:alpha/beta fold hydrolase [Acuticoccus yangtzensis]|uniref:alpha/beta fold hydrolase n=1 Tax=Acuticoccus yangtzensis TaxID=1443441 RepID=UPI0009494F85|nr:alpha/beta hydrolase [Acuticoccus yangtzensis]
MPTFTADDGCPIYYEDEGDGPAILFIPGLAGSGNFWSGVRAGLPGYRTLTLDHRGTGRSGMAGDSHTIPRIARDALALLDAAGLESAHIAGHSTGGMAAQHIAVTAPPRVERLVLSSTWGHADRRFRLMFEARLALLTGAGLYAYTQLTQAIGYDAATLDANAAALDADLEATRDAGPQPVQEARIRMLLGEPGIPDHADIIQPTMVIGAPDDAMIAFTHSERLAAAIPNSILVRQMGGHFFPRAYPDAYCAALKAFLGGQR